MEIGQSEFVGVDGCKAGWFSVGFDRRGNYEVGMFPAFSELLAHYGGVSLVLVDIPIGLPQGPEGRDCDREARKSLGPRRSSVFPAPTRQTVEQAAASPRDYESANGVERRFAGKGISKQAFAIAPKVAEVDNVMAAPGGSARRLVREVHPEVCFWALNDRQPMQFGKKTTEGEVERLRVLQASEPRSQGIFDEACSRSSRKDVAKDDILDALVAAVTACLGQGDEDRLQTFPAHPPTDSTGLPVEMVFLAPPTLKQGPHPQFAEGAHERAQAEGEAADGAAANVVGVPGPSEGRPHRLRDFLSRLRSFLPRPASGRGRRH